MAWDEFLYYQYADSIGDAYSFSEHASEDFDINQAFEPSAWDHKNHGPAYLLIARGPVYALQALTGIDKVAIWHLLNFITFLVGALFLYYLSLRWLRPAAAISLSVLYITQPVLWGHAFINPKDPPFATLFIIAIFFGLRMVDNFPTKEQNNIPWTGIMLSGIFIGLATNLRIVGPMIGVMLFIYAVLKGNRISLLWFIPVALIASITTYITWPYLWEAPILTFIEVLQTMANYPVSPKAFFYGQSFKSYEVPLRYLPVLLAITLSEPVWILFALGLGNMIFRLVKKNLEWKSLAIVIFWFAFMVAYILVLRPPMYDNYRHFLFILPPVFITAGFAFEQIFAWIRSYWLRATVLIAILAFGITNILKLHPYEYTYYNFIVGGTRGAEQTFATDYWLTCYKEAVEKFSEFAPQGATLITYREAVNAAYYAPENINIIGYRPFETGDYLLLSARLDEINTVKRHSPDIITIGRDGATFCVIKEIQ